MGAAVRRAGRGRRGRRWGGDLLLAFALGAGPGGCTTVGAVQDLVGPCPACTIEVEVRDDLASTPRLGWAAEHRRPGPLDGPPVWVPRYGVVRSGELDLPPVPDGCPLDVDVQAGMGTGGVAEGGVTLQGPFCIPARSLRDATAGELEPPPPGEIVCPLRARAEGLWGGGVGIVVEDRQGRVVAEARLPPPEPLQDPGRWAWLAAAPVVDVVVVPVNVIGVALYLVAIPFL